MPETWRRGDRMYFTDNPVYDAERYDEEQEALQRKLEEKAPECCICHKKIMFGYAYDFGDDLYAHEECANKEFAKINDDLADAAKEALWDSLVTADSLLEKA